MKTTNHTPGPWQIDKSALTGRIDIRKNHANGDSRILGYVWEDQNGESNANLIASAPDLLSALIALEKASRKVLDTSATHDGLENCKTLLEARIAIQKAKGEA